MINKLACTAALLAALPLSAPAADLDFFLKIDGIDGESQDSKHKNEIDVTSWSWGLSSVGGSVGGGGAGKPVFQDFSWLQGIDTSIPRIFLAVATGKHYGSAQLDVVKLGKDASPFFEMNFQSVAFSKLQLSGGGSGRPRWLH